MTTIMPEGEALRKAIKWISAELNENPDKSVQKLVNEAVTRFDLSPKDTEFLISFYKEGRSTSEAQIDLLQPNGRRAGRSMSPFYRPACTRSCSRMIPVTFSSVQDRKHRYL